MLLENQDWSNSDYVATASTYDSWLRSDPFFGRTAPEPAPLTALEQGVVAISLFDHPSSIEPPRALARFLVWAFGTTLPNQLADERLEALRRYCILLREAGGSPAAEENDRVRAAGFSEAALKEAGKLVALGW
ncbi:hypothetical protein ACFB49_30180 [Sphingomonas sp. DBB INV C78]|uniref:hypothetical protein n=1 Tax=Sphingomonas sp. DBB INV C78 TaxID=3349434 RepID=UPI0036D36102